MANDGLCNLHVKQLGPKALMYLTYLYNLSLCTATIPAIWTAAIIIPLPKQGNNPNISCSYRPISLHSPVIKLLERTLLPTLNEHLPLASHQHGFRPSHSTVTALSALETAVADGFNRKKPPLRTVLVSLDLTKAFDTVCHMTLLQRLLSR